MRKFSGWTIVAAIIITLFTFSGVGWADSTHYCQTPGSCTTGGDPGNNGNNPINIRNNNDVRVNNDIRVSNLQSQIQSQYQGQQQSLSGIISNSGGNVNNGNSSATASLTGNNIGGSNNNSGGNVNNGSPTASLIYNESKDRILAPDVNPYYIPILQSGRIGDFTGAIPEFVGIQKLAKGEKIRRVLLSDNGNMFNRIRLEDLYQKILDNASEKNVTDVDLSKVRYQVWFKDSVGSGGAGGGVSGSSGSIDQAATGSFLPGYHSSTHNPSFLVYFVEIQ